MLTTPIVVCSSLALAIVIVLLVREVRMRRAIQAVLRRFLPRRKPPDETLPPYNPSSSRRRRNRGFRRLR